jgi:hypothetical protein
MKPRGLPSLIVLQGLTLRRGPLRPTFDRRGLNLKEKSVCVCSTAHASPRARPSRHASQEVLRLTSPRSHPSRGFVVGPTPYQVGKGGSIDFHPAKPHYPTLDRKPANLPPSEGLARDSLRGPVGGVYVSLCPECSTAHGWPARNPSLSTLDLTSSRSRPSHRFTAGWLTLCQAANGVAADLYPTRRPYRHLHSGNRRTHPPPQDFP